MRGRGRAAGAQRGERREPERGRPHRAPCGHRCCCRCSRCCCSVSGTRSRLPVLPSLCCFFFRGCAHPASSPPRFLLYSLASWKQLGKKGGKKHSGWFVLGGYCVNLALFTSRLETKCRKPSEEPTGSSTSGANLSGSAPQCSLLYAAL